MDGNETSHRSQENEGLFQSPSSSNRSKRHSSLIKPLNGLKRMGSKLVPASWGKPDIKYETLDSSTDLLENPPKLPAIPSLLNKSNDSKESFLTSLDRLADYPSYQSNPAPGLGYKKQESVTIQSNHDPDPHHTEQGSEPSANVPRAITRENSTSFIPRYSNAPILFPSLMAPIRPGEQPQRSSIARSRTMINLEQRKAANKEARNKRVSTANYMRPTSSSIARRTSAIPSSPSVTVSPSTRRPTSAEHPLRLKLEQRESIQGSRLSSSNSSRALRANVTSDLPFRELYGSEAPPDGNNVQTASRPLRFMEDAYDALRASRIPKGTTTSLGNNARQAAPASTAEQGSEFAVAHRPGKEVVDLNEVKSPEFVITPKLNPGEAGEAGEASFHDSPGHTPLDLLGFNNMSFASSGGLDKSKLRSNALASPFTESETAQYEQGVSNIKRGKQREGAGVDGGNSVIIHNRQHETMGYYDEEGYTAPAKQGQRVESCEGDTIIRGGIGDTDTNSGPSIIMRANTISPMLLEEEEGDDPRNVSKALFALSSNPPFLFDFNTSLLLAWSSKMV